MTDDIIDLPFPQLNRNQQKGSKPRCHLLLSGAKAAVARRLTTLIAPFGEVTAENSWMPDGFTCCQEAQLTTAERIISDQHLRDSLLNWWLAVPGVSKPTTPNWDIASTCKIDGEPGILLIEAKAHDAELRNEERGKPLGKEDGKGVATETRRNHVSIGACIQEASLALSGETGLPWALSRDWNYQMANRFAWAWKLTELGKPVILVYLGFLGCEEMPIPIRNEQHWRELVEDHSRTLFPREVWNKSWTVHGHVLIPLIRVYDQRLDSRGILS